MTFEEHFKSLIEDLNNRFPQLVKKYNLCVNHSGGGCFHVDYVLNNKLSVSIVKDIIIILKYYKKNKKYKKYKKLRIDLIIRVLNDVINDNVNKYLIKEVLNYIHRESVSY